MKIKKAREYMWQFGFGFVAENYQVESSYYYEEFPSLDNPIELLEAWNSGSL